MVLIGRGAEASSSGGGDWHRDSHLGKGGASQHGRGAGGRARKQGLRARTGQRRTLGAISCWLSYAVVIARLYRGAPMSRRPSSRGVHCRCRPPTRLPKRTGKASCRVWTPDVRTDISRREAPHERRRLQSTAVDCSRRGLLGHWHLAGARPALRGAVRNLEAAIACLCRAIPREA